MLAHGVVRRAARARSRLAKAMKPADRRLRKETLDDFIAMVDREGGPGSIDLTGTWRDVSYLPTYRVNQTLDPFSEEYVAEQVNLYREISGRDIDQQANEMADFDMERHVAQANAFGIAPADLAFHYARLSKLMTMTRLPPNPRVLDLGCGWGMTSEFFATLGCEVTAVDINPRFIELVRRRSEARGLGITAVHGSFETVEVPGNQSLVTFYECLHHAIRPWLVIDRFAAKLSPSGAIAFAAEPVQDQWWTHWGLRLDPVSVYCIRKFGWFESGWSLRCLDRMFRRAGLLLDYREDRDPRIGGVGIAYSGHLKARFDSRALVKKGADGSWQNEGRFLSAGADNTLLLTYPLSSGRLRVTVVNYRQREVSVRVLSGTAGPETAVRLQTGENTFDVPYRGPGPYRFINETWSPRDETGSADSRQLSFHLEAVEIWTAVGPDTGA
jgi:2-polyprenyl-3-methyl-5-hydroxy-6-metoxy-1,4-benzoquinol methylase